MFDFNENLSSKEAADILERAKQGKEQGGVQPVGMITDQEENIAFVEWVITQSKEAREKKQQGQESLETEKHTFHLPVYMGRANFSVVEEAIQKHGYKVTHFEETPAQEVDPSDYNNYEYVQISVQANTEDEAWQICHRIEADIPQGDEEHQRY